MAKKRDQLIQDITNKIRRGSLGEEGKLPSERELAIQLGTSRNLLREALVALEYMGVLETRGREGIYLQDEELPEFESHLNTVRLWPEHMLRDLLEMRSFLEIPAAGLAAERRNSEDLQKMHQCLENLERIEKDGENEPGEGASWDSLLHMVIVEAADNRLLSRIYEDFSAVMTKYIGQSRALAFSQGKWPSTILEQHELLVQAIEEKDGDRAREIIQKHIDLARERFGE
jgi:GntR family transcriptional repressor for pyruvate dehydrogenase complex